MTVPFHDLILHLLVGGAVFLLMLLTLGLVAGRGRDRRFQRRLARVRRVATERAARQDGRARSIAVESATPSLDRIASRWLPRKEMLRLKLERTGRAVTIGHYLLWIAAAALAGFALALLAFRLSPISASLVALASGLALPDWLVRNLGRRWIARFNALFPDALDLIVRALRSGLTISEGIITVGQELAEPVGGEFRRIDQALKFGRTLEEALWDTARRLDTPEFGFFVISLSVQRQTGGNLAETLANLSDILRRRRQMRQKIRAVSSEARMSASILGALPFVVAALIFVTTPSYLAPLVTNPNGIILCAVGGAMLAAGTFIMARLIRFEV